MFLGAHYLCKHLLESDFLSFLKHMLLKQIILDNVQHALKLWLSMDIQSCSAESCLERASENVVPILCSVVDLLSLKVRYLGS